MEPSKLLTPGLPDEIFTITVESLATNVMMPPYGTGMLPWIANGVNFVPNTSNVVTLDALVLYLTPVCVPKVEINIQSNKALRMGSQLNAPAKHVDRPLKSVSVHPVRTLAPVKLLLAGPP